MADVALVTGASRGIGLEVARELSRAGYELILGVRDPAKAPKLSHARVVQLDMASRESIEAAARQIESLDVLVNNAAVGSSDPQVWETNLLGPLRLTRLLAPKLKAGGRVVMVSSGMGELSAQPEDLVKLLRDPALTVEKLEKLAPRTRYGQSKAALNALTQLFAKEYPQLRINSVCPGWVRTDMGGSGAPRSVEQGAASVLWATKPDAPTGGFYRDGQPISW